MSRRAATPAGVAADAPRAEVVDGDGLQSIEREWWELWRGCPSATPFQSPAWLLPWMRHYAPGRCGAALLRRAGRLAALVPVFTWRDAMLLAGTGPSDYGDGLFLPGTECFAGSLLAALIDVPCGTFSRIELRQLPPGSALLGTSAPPGWAETREEDEACLVAPLGRDDGLGAATKSCRSEWRAKIRRIGRAGGAIEAVRPDQVPQAMEELARLHGLRWRARGESGMFADPLLDRFLRDAAVALAGSGLLRMSRLRLGSETVAVVMNLAGPRAHFSYLGGFDPDRGKLGPSTALIGDAMTRAWREGAAEFDLLRGCEAYKYRWGAGERRTWRRIFARS